jgi:hypothetical protein
MKERCVLKINRAHILRMSLFCSLLLVVTLAISLSSPGAFAVEEAKVVFGVG